MHFRIIFYSLFIAMPIFGVKPLARIQPNRSLTTIPFMNQFQGKSSTLASLQVKPVRETLERYYQSSFDRYKPLIFQMIGRELEHEKTHYVFYHAHANGLRVVHDAIGALRTMKRDDFVCFREKSLIDSHAHVNGFIESYERTQNKWYDHTPYLSKHMLSTNISLFNNLDLPGESTFGYFVGNHSATNPHIAKLLKAVCNAHGHTDANISTLANLEQDLNQEPEGTLVQVFIPKALVDSCAYISQPFGAPVREIIEPDCYAHGKARHTHITPILDKYQDAPTSIVNSNRLQARLLLSPETMLNEKSDIRMYRYNMLSADQEKWYRSKFNAAIERLNNPTTA